jgi:hypothetical protein
MVKEVVSATEFDAELQAAGSKLVVVDFHALCECFVPTHNLSPSRHDLLTLLCNLYLQGVVLAKSSRPSSSNWQQGFVLLL